MMGTALFLRRRCRLPEGSNVVDVHMANLRAKLRDLDGYGLLRTVRGVGYALRG